MKTLPDPRRYLPSAPSELAKWMSSIDSSPASQQKQFEEFGRKISDLLTQDRESALREALRHPGSAHAHRTLIEALDHQLAPPRSATDVRMRLFAIPVLLVVGGSAGSIVPGVIPDIGAVTRLFLQAGALGPAKNFGFSNALTSLESLEAVAWLDLYRIARGASDLNLTRLDLPPKDIVLRGKVEQVALRFLAGAALTPADAPTIPETAGDIGSWGMPFTQMLAQQLALPGTTVLPIPRPPMSFVRAAQAGRFAHAELGFQLFLSDRVRKARVQFGEPDVTVAAFADGSLRVRLDSPLDQTFNEEYPWPLGPGDDLREVTNSLFGLLAEVRLDRIEVLDTVQPTDKRG